MSVKLAFHADVLRTSSPVLSRGKKEKAGKSGRSVFFELLSTSHRPPRTFLLPLPSLPAAQRGEEEGVEEGGRLEEGVVANKNSNL